MHRYRIWHQTRCGSLFFVWQWADTYNHAIALAEQSWKHTKGLRFVAAEWRKEDNDRMA